LSQKDLIILKLKQSSMDIGMMNQTGMNPSTSKRSRDNHAISNDFHIRNGPGAQRPGSVSESFSSALCGNRTMGTNGCGPNSNSFDISGVGASFRLPDMIDILAREGQCLRWDENQTWYEVTNGPLMEEKLRSFHGNRKDEATDRPFSKMHIHFLLVRGDKWGVTGSTFRPKYELPHKSEANCDDYPLLHAPNMGNRACMGQYTSAPMNYQTQPMSCFRSVLTEQGMDLAASKRYRTADEQNMAENGPQSARNNCSYPMAVSFSDALAGSPPSAGRGDLACRAMECEGNSGDSLRQASLMQVWYQILTQGPIYIPLTTVSQSVADKLAKSEAQAYDDDDGREDLPWTGSDAGGSSGGGGMGGGGGNGKQMCLRLPELIDTLAKEGQVLRWDESQRLYEVRSALSSMQFVCHQREIP
jgi:hypothetical protein